jgi:hypothetical protein
VISVSVYKRGKRWYYDFGNHKHRGVIPEARTKREAQQAENAIKAQVFAARRSTRRLSGTPAASPKVASGAGSNKSGIA